MKEIATNIAGESFLKRQHKYRMFKRLVTMDINSKRTTTRSKEALTSPHTSRHTQWSVKITKEQTRL